MKVTRFCGCIFVFLVVTCSAQSPPTPVTPVELGYFKFMLTHLGSPEATTTSIQMQERQLVLRFGLNDAELGVIDSTRSQMGAILAQARQSTAQVASVETSLSSADLAALAAIDSQMDQQIGAVANSILAAVRPETAARLRAPGDIIANGLAGRSNTANGGH